MVNKDQAFGAIICIVCVAIAAAYIVALFWPALDAIRLWLITIPVLVAFVAVLAIGAWIGWTMVTTPPPKPIEETQLEQTEEKEETRPVEK
jgi:predicted DNA-binding transcriptional regulator